MRSFLKSSWRPHLLSLLCLCFSELCLGQKCPDGMHYFPPDSCVSLAAGSRNQCPSQTTDGLAVLTESQLSSTGVLGQYAAAVLASGELMWLGYTYDGSGNLVTDGGGSSVTITNSVLNNEGNFNLTRSVSPGSNVCVAVSSERLFVRTNCNENLRWSLCQKNYGVPGADVSASPSIPAAGQAITLTCTRTNPDSSVMWMFASDPSSPPTSESSLASFTISSFSDASNAGAYFCVETTAVWGIVHQPVVLRTTASSSDSNSFNITAPSATYNAALTLSCSYDLSGATFSRVLWFINGVYVANTTDLVLEAVRQSGYYQCVAVGNTGITSVGTAWIIPQPGVPGAVDVIYSEPSSSSSLDVSWFCPLYPGTYSPILLSYRLSYNESSTASSSSVSMRAPVNMGQDSCFVRTSVSSLKEGTMYSVSVLALAGDTTGQEGLITADASTFGQAPGSVQGLKVFRSEDNKTVFANWDKLETTPPVGVVEEYYVEYRETEKKSASTVRKSPDQTFVYIINVINANSYQVRVRAGVLSSNNPTTYNYGPFTEWMQVGGIAPTPTGGLHTGPRAGAIAAGVVVGGLAFIVIITIFIVGVICFTVKQRESGSGVRFRRKRQPSINKELTSET